MATNENSRFSMFRGDTRILRIAVTDSNGDDVTVDTAQAVTFGLFDLEPPHALVLLRTLDDDPDPITLAGNVITVTLPAAETEALLGTYLFEAQLIDVNGLVFTVLRGEVTVYADLLTPAVLA